MSLVKPQPLDGRHTPMRDSPAMHIRQLPSGTWRVIVKHNGVQRTATGPTRGDVHQLGAEMLLEMGARPEDRHALVGDLLAGHLADVHNEWSPTTWADAKRVVDRLPTTFTCRRVRDVTPAVVAGLYRQLRTAGWSEHRLRRLRMVLNGAWKRAISYEWARSNPCRDVPLRKVARPELRPPTDVEVAAVLAECSGAVQLFVRLAVITGARRGEIVALQWDDVDVDHATLTIHRSLVQIPGAAPTARPTKTGSKGFRVLALDLPTVARLRRHRAEQRELALAAGLPAPVWVFSHDAGQTPWRPIDIIVVVQLERTAWSGSSGQRKTRRSASANGRVERSDRSVRCVVSRWRTSQERWA